MAVLGNETTHESATISWVNTLADPGEFKRFVIEYKKKLVSRDVESPSVQLCYEIQPSCKIKGLETTISYEIRVKVDTYNFGESEFAGPVIVKTASLSDSDLSAIEKLEIAMVSYIVIKSSYIHIRVCIFPGFFPIFKSWKFWTCKVPVLFLLQSCCNINTGSIITNTILKLSFLDRQFS